MRPLTKDGVLQAATAALSAYPRLNRLVPASAIERAVASNWPNPPPPLILWLTVEGLGLVGRDGAHDCLLGLEAIILLAEKGHVRGAWRERVRKLLPPKRPAGFEHYSGFVSSLFELILSVRLLATGFNVELRPDTSTPACDIEVTSDQGRIVDVEAYAPQKGLQNQFTATVVDPWGDLVSGTDRGVFQSSPVTRFSIDPLAAPSAVSRVLTDGNFAKQKAVQLSSAPGPTILAIRAYWLTPDLTDLITMPEASLLASAIGAEAWSRLPPRCLGLLVAFIGDSALNVFRGGAPTMFVPAPGRSTPQAVWDYLDHCGTISRTLTREPRN